jgi:DegV family protein with EDD domain
MTDSTADLGNALSAPRQIRVIPLTVNLNGKTYKDGIDLNQRQLFERIREEGQLPTTAAPSVGEFIDFFRPVEEGIYLSISSRLSASSQNACLAVKELGNPRIKVIDSLNLSSGIGLLALKAADWRDQGLALEEIEKKLADLVPGVRTAFILESLDYLYKGGRCNALQALASSVLKIRPLIYVQPDGTLGVGEKTRGKRSRALQVLLERFQSHLEQMDLSRVFVTHAACPQDATYLVDEIQRLAKPREILVNEAGSVISSHCGPGTIGILYLLKS